MPVLSLQQGVDGYTGTVDTIIRAKSVDADYSALPDLVVDGADNAGQPIQALLSFGDIFGDGPGQIPLGAMITSATLTVQVTNGSDDSLGLHRMLRDWEAMPARTWAGFGGDGIQADGTEAAAQADLEISGLSIGSQTLDVTDSLQFWSDGAENHGWALLQSGGDGATLMSSEGPVAPILNVEWEYPVNPVAGIDIVESNGSTFLYEGGMGDTYSVALTMAPRASVTLYALVSNARDFGGYTNLSFTPNNWDVPQTVTLSAIDDRVVESTESFGIRYVSYSQDSNYRFQQASFTGSIIDNDYRDLPPLTPALDAAHITTAAAYAVDDPSGYGISDPSGIAYVPGLGLFIADSEHNESPYFSSTNLFLIGLDGHYIDAFSLMSFTNEPTGLAYNPHNGLLYISDDDADRIYWVDPSNPTVVLGQINVRIHGITDAEDPVIDPVTGNIFLLDGAASRLFELEEDGDLVNAIDLPAQIPDAEGLAFDADLNVFYVSSGASRGEIFRLGRDGALIDSTDFLDGFRHLETGGKPKLKGLELAPSSDPTDGDAMSLYAVDYGISHGADGRLFEIDLYSGWDSA